MGMGRVKCEIGVCFFDDNAELDSIENQADSTRSSSLEAGLVKVLAACQWEKTIWRSRSEYL